MRNIKFHLMAVSVMIAIVVVVFIATGQLEPNAPTTAPDAAPVAAPQRNGNLSIAEAHWGLNCVDALKSHNQRLETRIEATTEPTLIEKLKNDRRPLPERNNALEKMNELCGGKVSCDFTTTHQVMGTAGFNGCSYELELVYRCFVFDRRRLLSARYRQDVSLSCEGIAP